MKRKLPLLITLFIIIILLSGCLLDEIGEVVEYTPGIPCSFISTGYNFSMAVSTGGDAYLWGFNGSGTLGNGATINSSNPQKLTVSQKIISLSGSQWHTAAVAADGKVYTWGDNSFGQLGVFTGTQHNIPVQVTSLDHLAAISVAAGGLHTLVLTEDGVWSFGYNGDGQLGVTSATPYKIQALDDLEIVQIAAGEFFSMALSATGQVYTWGSNEFGQLGLGTGMEHVSTPTLVQGLPNNIIKITARKNHALALTSDGKVYSWGQNNSGQTGDGTTTNHYTPVKVKGLDGIIIKKISAGTQHSIALSDDGKVFAWGLNESGQLGIENPLNTVTPYEITSLNKVIIIDIAAGGEHTLFLTNTGAIYACGSNLEGQLGINGNNTESVPIPVKL